MEQSHSATGEENKKPQLEIEIPEGPFEQKVEAPASELDKTANPSANHPTEENVEDEFDDFEKTLEELTKKAKLLEQQFANDNR